ncbi:acylphosphatase [Erythrobacter litoralis]|uniref:acylphosphatase n=1 Tax=Erythrobacter litoralis TaxID=39960 RepID=UPI0024356E8E|nr:acylphosphatase [Erythrobacter litoralis]MDG6078608.1 acylphosphatase [Erythrobacter litoralis]
MTQGPTTARHLILHGRVQGVFYRDWTVDTARSLGLAGWVRNRPDGTVEAQLEGASDAVERMIAAMHDGPPRADVERIEQRQIEPEGLSGFERR